VTFFDDIRKKLREQEISVDQLDVKFTSKTKLGGGAFGDVFCGKYQNREVAVKVLKFTQLDNRIISDFKREISVLCKISTHPNIVTFIGWAYGNIVVEGSVSEKRLMIVTELVPGQTIYAFRKFLDCNIEHSILGKPLDQNGMIDIAHQICSGMAFIHKKGIAHRDLKSENVMVYGQYKVIILDFGLSRALNNTTMATHHSTPRHGGGMTTIALGGGTLHWTCRQGTVCFEAPEILFSRSSNYFCGDVYSFAIVLYELVTGKLSWDDLPGQDKERALREKLMNNERPTIPYNIAVDYPQLVALICDCWELQPQKRPTFRRLEQIFADLKNGKVPKRYPIDDNDPMGELVELDTVGDPITKESTQSAMSDMKSLANTRFTVINYGKRMMKMPTQENDPVIVRRSSRVSVSTLRGVQGTDDVVDMLQQLSGRSREQVVDALRTSDNNPDRAFYRLTGMT